MENAKIQMRHFEWFSNTVFSFLFKHTLLENLKMCPKIQFLEKWTKLWIWIFLPKITDLIFQVIFAFKNSQKIIDFHPKKKIHYFVLFRKFDFWTQFVMFWQCVQSVLMYFAISFFNYNLKGSIAYNRTVKKICIHFI